MAIAGGGAALGQQAIGYQDSQPTVGFPNEFTVPSSRSAYDLGSSKTVFLRHSDHDMWNTILIISAVVGVVGILNDDSGLIVIGAAGVVVSVVQMNGNGFRLRPSMFDRGLNCIAAGPISFGVDPLGQLEDGRRTAFTQPGLYLKATFRF